MAEAGSTDIIALLRETIDTGVCFDPRHSDAGTWDLEARWLLESLVDPEGVGKKKERRLCLHGARFNEAVDLGGVSIPFPLVFEQCVFDQPLQLESASLAALRIRGGKVADLEARRIHVAVDLELSDGVQVTSPVRLVGAAIDGTLHVAHATLDGDGEVALDCDRATVGENLMLGAKTRLGAALHLKNCHVKGNLHCSAHIAHADGLSIGANLLTVDGNATFDGDYACVGTVDLTGATIGGRLHFDGGVIAKGADRANAIEADGLAVAQNADFDGGVSIEGVVQLPFARLSAQLCFNGVTLRACDAMALNGQGAEVAGDVVISQESEVFGSVDFTGAIIKGDLACDHATLRQPGGGALVISRADIGGATFLDHSKVWGEVTLMGTHIGGDLNCLAAEIHNPGKSAILARRAKLDKEVLLNDGFIAEGAVDLVRVVVGGGLRCEGGSFSAPGQKALDLRGAQIGGVFWFQPKEKPQGEVNLRDAQCAVLRDDESAWPDLLVLDGFSYRSFDAEPNVGQRVRWLERNHGYSARIYEQLIGVLRANGNEEGARNVALARQRQRARLVPIYVRALYWVWGATVGYGYSLRRLLPWLVGLLATGTVFFWAMYPVAFTPTSKTTPTFNSFIYTLDLLVPVIRLGQSDAWVTSGAALYVGWIFTIVGWALAAALVAGLSQVVRRN
jgi:hypothetical protein